MAHALKGVCASIGAIRLTAVANGLMRCSREDLKRTESRLRIEVVETAVATMEGIHAILTELDDMKAAENSTAFLHTN